MISATGSNSSFELIISIFAPISFNTFITPSLVGLIPTFSSISSESGTKTAAAIKNAAEDISEGTSISVAKSSLQGFIVAEVFVVFKFAPNFFNINSVWSLDFAGSITVVGESAYNPARSMADFTCALATGELYSIP